MTTLNWSTVTYDEFIVLQDYLFNKPDRTDPENSLLESLENAGLSLSEYNQKTTIWLTQEGSEVFDDLVSQFED